MKADPRCAEKTLKEWKPQEGNEPRAVLTGRAGRRIDGRIKALKAGRRGLEHRGNPAQASGGNDRRAPAGDEPGGLASGETPEEEILDVAAG